jgi:hypothetical protein
MSYESNNKKRYTGIPEGDEGGFYDPSPDLKTIPRSEMHTIKGYPSLKTGRAVSSEDPDHAQELQSKKTD